MTIYSLVLLPSQFWTSVSTSGSNCCFLTHKQVSQETGKMVCYSYLFKNFPLFVMIHTVKDFSVVSETEVDVCLEFLCFLHDLSNVGNLISGSSAFSKTNLYIWKFSLHVLLKPNLKDFEHYFAIMWNEHNYIVVWTLVGIVLLWDWNENSPFPVMWPLLSFPTLLTYWVQYFNSIIF